MKYSGYYWRIIRTNSTEGTRLLYAGISPDTQEAYINNEKYNWNSIHTNPKNLSWSNSSFNSTISVWYNSHINESMINTSVPYCNDMKVSSTDSNRYQVYENIVSNKTPSYNCDTNGNLTHRKVGLMTADEVAFAGGINGKSTPNTYYYRNSITSGCTGSKDDPCSVTGNNCWWTMSPSYFNKYSYVFAVHFIAASDFSANITSNMINNSCYIRPVITLLPEVLVSGSGTASDPFVPSLTN